MTRPLWTTQTRAQIDADAGPFRWLRLASGAGECGSHWGGYGGNEPAVLTTAVARLVLNGLSRSIILVSVLLPKPPAVPRDPPRKPSLFNLRRPWAVSADRFKTDCVHSLSELRRRSGPRLSSPKKLRMARTLLLPAPIGNPGRAEDPGPIALPRGCAAYPITGRFPLGRQGKSRSSPMIEDPPPRDLLASSIVDYKTSGDPRVTAFART